MKFPKSARILKSAEFRKVYGEGSRIGGQHFTAFCLAVPRAAGEGPRIGFTLPRAFGKAVRRNGVKRRLRELLRMRRPQIHPQWDIVINPRRAALDASPQDLEREVERLISRCARS